MNQDRAIQLALRGQERGFKWLFERHRMPLFRFICRQSRLSAAEADDILQNVFVRAFRSLDGLQDPRRFEGWMLRIARRETLRYLAKRRVEDPLEEELASGAQQAADQAAAAEKERLMTAIRTLADKIEPPSIRETAKRYYLGERCTTEDLARELEIPHATVRKRLYLFRNKLRALVLEDLEGMP